MSQAILKPIAYGKGGVKAAVDKALCIQEYTKIPRGYAVKKRNNLA